MEKVNKNNQETGLTTQPPQTVIKGRGALQVYQTATVYAPFREMVQRGHIQDVKQQIARALITGYEIAGVPPANWPSDILKPIISEFILNNYSGFNENDILNAFLFAVEGRFGSVNPDARGGLLELYNKPVSLLWISDILKAYSVWRAGELDRAKQTITRAAKDPVKEYLKTRPLNNMAVREILIKTFADVMEGSNKTEFLLPEFYGFLEDSGLIELDTQEKRDIMDVAQKQLFEEAKDTTTSGGGFLKIDPLNPDNVTDRAKKLAIIIMFEKFKIRGLDEYTVIGLFDRVCYLSPTSHRKLFAAQNELNARE